MRYIGNKTKLLEFIDRVLDSSEIRKGRAFDAFSGTASVGRHLKRKGFEVISADLMTFSFVLQEAYTVLDYFPTFSGLLKSDPYLSAFAADARTQQLMEERFGTYAQLFAEPSPERIGLQSVILYLENGLPGKASFVTGHYSPAHGDEPGDRMFFTRANAERIDAAREQIEAWRQVGLLNDGEFYLLLASVIEAADAVANTAGVYAAYMKSWQSNALRAFRMPVPDLVVNTGLKCTAIQGDANEVIGQIRGLNLLYLDPPYNTRQYSSYYHVPEVLAKGWFDTEPVTRGKTGLINDADKKSRWSTRAGCVGALEELVSRADARHVLMSYNSEGIIPESEIGRIFRENGRAETFQVFERSYDRYRSDRDHETRRYKADNVIEKIYYVRGKST